MRINKIKLFLLANVLFSLLSWNNCYANDAISYHWMGMENFKQNVLSDWQRLPVRSGYSAGVVLSVNF